MRPPIYEASFGSSAIAASHTVDFFQFDPTNANAVGELGRLTRAGMVMLASSAQLTVIGYWKFKNVPTPDSVIQDDKLCKNTLVDTSKLLLSL
jgi:hypothetical protein